MICPRAFLESMKPHRDVANILLDYAYTHKIKAHIQHVVASWKPLFVYRVPVDTYTAPRSPNDRELGVFTEQAYSDYRRSQCIFHDPELLGTPTADQHMYVGTMDPTDAYSFDRFVEFDIQFQHYIVGVLAHRNTLLGKQTVLHPSDAFEDILDRYVGSFDAPVIEEWEGMGLF
jgi:hypothetical protein